MCEGVPPRGTRGRPHPGSHADLGDEDEGDSGGNAIMVQSPQCLADLEGTPMNEPVVDVQAMLLLDPGTSPEQLHEIATQRPDLWGQVATHPNVYPELVQWMASQAPGMIQPAAPATEQPVGGQQTPATQQTVGGEFPATPVAAQMPNAAAPAKRRSTGKIAAIVGGVLAVIALGAGAFWFFKGGSATGQPTATRVEHAPSQTSVVDLRSINSTGHMQRFGKDRLPLVPLDRGFVVAFVGEDDLSTLVAFEDSDGGEAAAWSVQVPAATVTQGCTFAGAHLTCGDGEDEVRFDLTGGVPVPETETYESLGSPASTPADSDTETGNAETGETEAQETETEKAETEETDESESEQDSPVGTEDPDSQGGPDGALWGQPVPIPSSPDEDAPYFVEDGELLDASGKAVSGGPLGEPAWGQQFRDTNQWLISDGNTVASVAGNKELWVEQLPAGSAALNGFEGDSSGPTWLLSGATLVLGTPSGVIARDTTSGEILWEVDQEVTSWASTDEELLITTQSELHLYEYPDGESEPQSEDTQGLTAALADLPDPDTVANATLDVGVACAEQSGAGYDGTVQFQDGVASGQGNGNVQQRGVGYTILDGEPMVVVGIQCIGFLPETAANIATYDSDLNLVSLTTDIFTEVQWATVDGGPNIADFSVFGKTVHVTTNDLLVTNYGGDGGDYITADVTMAWDGDSFQTVDVVYNGPDGPVRAPDLEFLQAIFDALEAGDDHLIEGYVGAGILESIQSSEASIAEWEARVAAGEDLPPIDSPGGRPLYAPTGGGIAGCTLIPTHEFGAYIKESRRLVYAPYGWSFSWDAEQVQPGDFVCGVNMGMSSIDNDTNRPHDLWWYVRTDQNGKPYVHSTGRNFS